MLENLGNHRYGAPTKLIVAWLNHNSSNFLFIFHSELRSRSKVVEKSLLGRICHVLLGDFDSDKGA